VTAPLRIVFFGTPDFAVPSLRALLAAADPVAGVVCQPDKPAGRGRRLMSPPVKSVALEAAVPVLQPEKLRAPEFIEGVQQWDPGLIVVAAYGKILPGAVLDLPRHGCINVHASLLPKYRGAAPIQWAILRGEQVTGVTIMRMNERMDAGDILLQREVVIGADETYGELQARLAVIGATALTEALARLRSGTLAGTPQCEAEVTLAPMIKKEDGRIDWAQSAIDIARRVRAFHPWPSAFTFLKGKLLKIHRAHPTNDAVPGPPGRVASVHYGIAVATGAGTSAGSLHPPQGSGGRVWSAGAVVLDELQLEGRKRLAATDFARGGGIAIGTLLG